MMSRKKLCARSLQWPPTGSPGDPRQHVAQEDAQDEERHDDKDDVPEGGADERYGGVLAFYAEREAASRA